ncbi:MAG: CHASE2 domain-containing protein, partial [Calditrichaeota bacterium]
MFDKHKIYTFSFGWLLSLGLWIGLALFLRHIPILWDYVERNDYFLYDWIFEPEGSIYKDLVIVDSEDYSARMDRQRYAGFIETLRKAGASIIGVDLRFFGETRPQADRKLIESTSLADSTRVIHAFALLNRPAGSLAADPLLSRFALKLQVMPRPRDCISANSAELPFTGLLKASRFLGNITLPADSDQKFRRLPLVMAYQNEIYPSMALEIVRRYFNVSDQDFEIHFGHHNCENPLLDTSILLKNTPLGTLKIPVDHFGQLLINYADEKIFQRYSMAKTLALLQKARDAKRFAGKIILLVNSNADNERTSLTPLDTSYPMWGIHASVVSQMLANKTIEESGFASVLWSECLLALLLGWVVFGESRQPPAKRKPVVVLALGLLAYFAIA